MKRWLVAVSVLVTLGAAPRAHAEEPARERWYGYQTMAVDATAIGLLAATGAIPEGAQPWMAGGAIGLYALGPAVVHGANARGGAGLGSFGMRLGLPIVGALMGLGIGASSSFKGLFELAGAGAFVGALTAMVLDAAFLARKTVPAEPGAPSTPSALSLVVPWGGAF